MEKVFIFVPVYFREAIVRRASQSLLETYYSEEYEVRVVFVDNRSNDSLRDYLQEIAGKDSNVTVKLFDKNVGKGKAINETTTEHCEFDWFINCDSDILPLTKGWPGMLVDCYKQISRAGMVSTNYVKNGNNPMPHQPEKMKVEAGGKKYTFCYGGQVAGGCFVSERTVWNNLGYRNSGVYGGIDGIFRQNVADSLMRKCGYIKEVVVEHLDDRKTNADYYQWKLQVQAQIKKYSPLAPASVLGNEKGFWDV